MCPRSQQCDVNTNRAAESIQRMPRVQSVRFSLFFCFFGGVVVVLLDKNFLGLYGYGISITHGGKKTNAGMPLQKLRHGKMETGNEVRLHPAFIPGEAAYLCLMRAVYRKRDFNG